MISLRDFIYIFSNNHTILLFLKITQDTAVFVISEILDFEKILALFVENAAALSSIHEVVLFFLFMTTGHSLITFLFP